MKRLIWRSVCFCFVAVTSLGAPILSAGQATYIENFATTQHKDVSNTTAVWNTTAGAISLHPFVLASRGSYDTPGHAYGVCVSGNYAYVADGGGGLRIINISNPSAPTLAGSYDTSTNSQGIDVSGNHVFLADQMNGLLIFDVSNPGVPSLVGSFDTPDRACRVHVEGDYAYVADRLSGLLVIDVSNPAAPTLAGSYDTPVDAQDVFVSGDHAFVTDNTNGFLVIDVSNPTAPFLAGSCPTPGEANSVYVSGDHAYVTDSGFGLLAIDISDPTAPAIVGSHAIPVSTRGIYVTGDCAYVAETSAGIEVFDISNPASPARINSYDTPGSSEDVVVAGDLAFIPDGESGLQIINAAEIVAPPVYIGGYDSPGSAGDIHIEGDLAYIADQTSGMQIVDISDPANPSLKGSYSITGSDYPMHLDVAGNYVYIAAYDGGLQVVDVTNAETPLLVGSHYTPDVAYDVEVDGDYAYVAAYEAGVQIFNITDPTNPTLAGSFATPGYAQGITIEGDYAYVAISNSGLQILDISDPGNPIGIGIFSGGYGIDVAVEGRYAYLASISYFRVIDVSHPSSPVQVGSYPITQFSFGVTIEGKYAFLAADQQGLLVFNIANPTHPLLKGSIDTPTRANGVAVAGDYAFVVDDVSGLQVCGVFERALDRMRIAENIVQSTVVDASAEEIVSLSMITAQRGTIQWEVSADGGQNWESVAPNIGWQSLTHTGTDLLWRALFVYDQPGLNPRCSSLQIEWCTSVGRVVVYFDEALSDADTCIANSEDQGVYAYVTAEGFGSPLTGIEFKIQHPPGYRLIAETCPFPLRIGTSTNGVSVAFGRLVDASYPVHVYTLIYQDQHGTCGDCSLPAGPVSVVPHPNSPSGLIEATDRYLNFVYATGATSHLCYSERRDSDNDGVANAGDLCPYVSSAYFDRNGDGCLDDAMSARHVEYWGVADTMVYYISEDAAPNITDGSDMTALIQSMNTWPALFGSDIPVVYGGTTPAVNADAFDQINMITFKDPVTDDSNNRYFSDAIIAVGITTSFTEPTLYNKRWYRPGEIFDADMLFNPGRIFTTSGGAGIDLQSVATHEAGHLYGLSHSALRTSTMFPILGHGTETSSLTVEDSLQFIKSYPDAAETSGANRIRGAIEDYYGNPVHGAAIFAIDAGTGDTTACEYTLSDGSYTFLGLPDGSYYVSIHPLNGSASVGYVEPAAINWLVYSWGVTNFVPEHWDDNESAMDNPVVKTPITVGGGSVAVANIVTNIDLEPPTIVTTTPAGNVMDVRADGTIIIQFSEAIDHTTLQGNFRLVKTGTNQGVGGNASVLEDGTLMTFTPWDLLAYSTAYVCSLKTGLADQFGNTLAAPFAFAFSTESAPPLSLKSMVPDKGVPGSVVIFNGAGFDTTVAHNTVLFTNNTGTGTVLASIVSASQNQLVAIVPGNAGTGDVVVAVGPSTTQSRTFTLLSASAVVRGYEIGKCNLSSPPRAHIVMPDESEAFVATRDGVSIVGVVPGLPDFCVETVIPVSGGLDDIAVTPDGRWVYGICKGDSILCVIDPVNRTVPFSIQIGAEPVGITIDQGGRRAYIPTTNGTIQKWDVEEGSPTQREQVGVITSADSNLRSSIGIDPTGEVMLAISGAGKMLVFHTETDAFLGSVSVGSDPRDIVIEPSGLRAYISDGSGEVTIVALRSSIVSPVDPFKVLDIKTGGSLRKAAISPAGNYLFSANRQLNLIDVIDLHPSNATYRTVAATIPQGINPIEVNLSSNGDHAYSIVEQDQQLVVLGVGVGPALISSSKAGGPEGTKLVFSGAGFGWDVDTVRVLFGDPDQDPVIVQADWTINTALGVTTPAGVPSGPISIRTGTSTFAYSNELYFKHLDPTPSPGQLRLVSKIEIDSLLEVGIAVAVSATGNQMIVGTASGNLLFVDTDLNSPLLNQVIHNLSTGIPDIYDIDITPDGTRAYVSFDGEGSIIVVDCNRSSSNFGTVIGTVQNWAPYPMTDPLELSISPDGGTCLVHDVLMSGWNRIYRVDINPDSPTYNTALDTVVATVSLDVNEIVYHPGGLYAYAVSMSNRRMHVIDMYPTSVNFRRVVNTITIPGILGGDETPVSCSFLPDGSKCLVLIKRADFALGEHRCIRSLDTSDPASPILGPSIALIDIIPGNPSQLDRIDVSPRGDRAVVHCANLGLYNFNLTTSPYQLINSFKSFAYRPKMDLDFASDGSYVYAASPYEDNLHVFDFSGADIIAYVSGNGQTGIIEKPLAALLRIQVTSGGQPSAGVAVSYHVESGGGRFAASNSSVQTAATDAQGYAQVEWILGPDIGLQTVSATADGLGGSPVEFSATAIVNPAVLPLQFAGAIPLNGAQGVGITTTVIARFSRGVDRSTLIGSNFFLRKTNETQAIPAKLGITDEGRTASLTPRSALDISASDTLEIRAGIKDRSGGSLVNPSVSSFTTMSPPPLKLSSINPRSSVRQVMIVLAGAGFSPTASDNSVLFNELAARPVEAGFDYLKVIVPHAAKSGTIQVQVGEQVSNSIPFNVLEPLKIVSDKIIATIDTDAATKCIVIHPTGIWAYAVSPEGNVVVPINIPQRRSLPGIPVGNHPISVAMHPEGTFIYVANFQSSSVSIINVDSSSPDFHKPDTTLTVGNYPIDLAVGPDGDRVYVVNTSDDEEHNVDILDSDEGSANYHSVLATVGTGAATRSVVMTPDGSRLYFGTDTGYIVLDALDYGVLATVGTGAATKSVIMHPDGGLLFILTTEGEVLIVDIMQGSTKENSVLATVGRGTSTKSITLSPDGSQLYLIQEELDKIIIYGLAFLGSATVIDPDALFPPVQIHTTVIDTIEAGEDPEDMVFDPAGTGLTLVTNSGPKTVTFLSTEALPPDTLIAELQISPRTLNLKSRGRWIHGRIELDSAFLPEDIDLSTVQLRDTVPAELDRWTIEDADADGVRELVATFDRAVFQTVMPQGEYVPVWVTGMVGDHPFLGEDTIRTIRPTVHYPNGGAVSMNKPITIRWTSPAGFGVDMVDVYWSPDDGASWFPIAAGIPDVGSVGWFTPATPQDSCRVMVTLYRNGEDIGMGMNQEMFVVDDLTGVGEAPLVTSLAQNYPNPFNPTTTIEFSLKEDAHVSLRIYNVAGQLVRTLIDKDLGAGVYKNYTWDGLDNHSKHVASGVYFYRLVTENFNQTRKMVLLK